MLWLIIGLSGLQTPHELLFLSPPKNKEIWTRHVWIMWEECHCILARLYVQQRVIWADELLDELRQCFMQAGSVCSFRDTPVNTFLLTCLANWLRNFKRKTTSGLIPQCVRIAPVASRYNISIAGQVLQDWLSCHMASSRGWHTSLIISWIIQLRTPGKEQHSRLTCNVSRDFI